MTDGSPRPPAAPPLSPCVRICVMDAERRYCTGCRRTLDEIAGWWTMSDERKRAVLGDLPARTAAPERT